MMLSHGSKGGQFKGSLIDEHVSKFKGTVRHSQSSELRSEPVEHRVIRAPPSRRNLIQVTHNHSNKWAKSCDIMLTILPTSTSDQGSTTWVPKHGVKMFVNLWNHRCRLVKSTSPWCKLPVAVPASWPNTQHHRREFIDRQTSSTALWTSYQGNTELGKLHYKRTNIK